MDLARLGAWEAQLVAAMARITGYVEERVPQLAGTGAETEYRAIFTAYADLLADPAQAPEALRRAAFLAWYAYAEPAWLSGVGELPAAAERRVMVALEATLAAPAPDPELVAMLRHYAGVVPLPFELHRDLPHLQWLLAAAPDHEQSHRWRPSVAAGRGQMGDYWASLRRDA